MVDEGSRAAPADEPCGAEDIPPEEVLPGLTGIVPCRNEEGNLEACLDSFAGLCDELIVIDSFSTDRSVEIARRYTERIYQRPWKDYRTFLHFAMPKARHRWLLIVDCDERVSPRLAHEIREWVERDGGGYDGFRMLRVNHFLGRRIRHSGWGRDYIYRFFRKGKGGPRDREVHPGIVIDGPIEALDGPMMHFPYPSFEDYLEKLNRYTSAAARDRLARGRRARWVEILFAPLFRFLKSYVLRLGFLDGYPGFVLAKFSAFYIFARYAKMRAYQQAEEIERRNRELSAAQIGGGRRGALRPPRP